MSARAPDLESDYISSVEGHDDEVEDDSEDDALLAELNDGDIPVTGFAVASNKRNADFHELFRSIPEGDYLIEGVCPPRSRNHCSPIFHKTMVALCSVRFLFKVAYTSRRTISVSMRIYLVGSPTYVARNSADRRPCSPHCSSSSPFMTSSRSRRR
jgi:hypothetical protein